MKWPPKLQGHQFQGAELHSESRRNDPPINTNTFYTKLCESIENRLIDSEDADIAEWARVLEQNRWPTDVQDNLTFGEMEVRSLCKKLQLPERDMIRGLREYLVEKKVA